MKFTKMQGAGNDYVYVDCTQNELKNASEVAVAVSDRHFGIGSDGLILIKNPTKQISLWKCITRTVHRAACAATVSAASANMYTTTD